MRLIILAIRWFLCLMVFGAATGTVSIILSVIGLEERTLIFVIINILFGFYPTILFNEYFAKALIKAKIIGQQDYDLIQSTKHTFRFFVSKTFLYMVLYAIAFSVLIFTVRLFF